jgi:hypothetical protein
MLEVALPSSRSSQRARRCDGQGQSCGAGCRPAQADQRGRGRRRTLKDAQQVEHDRWLVTNHLEGNFPGGVVDLRYHVALTNGVISELEIAP